MGCFLACFGLSHKRKRRKPAHKGYGGYEPLDSSVTIVRLSSAENPTSTKAYSEPRHKPKEQPSSKIRKKVRFNPNVQTYEPISTSSHFLEDEEDEKLMRKCEERADESLSTSKGSFNLNYRYQNCRDFYDEDDDIAFESDLYDEDDYNEEEDEDEYDGDIDIDSQRVSQDEFSKELNPSSVSSDKKVSSDKSVEKKDTSAHSVLKPVENLTQWRAAKAKTASSKQPREENISLFQKSSCRTSLLDSGKPYPLLQEIAVDSSLSSWLNPTSTYSV
ncbi:FK506-binding nuclear-like protein [Parasponia andersonii]|uniref:FK506-binding nuclear-like protein n=1 Tax=Parasponia andersonii TaxID=3476 RepID=A0A2P5AB98_PARAD|nr:FK506-binding nuclear-like protein [Parasponia andersonii]